MAGYNGWSGSHPAQGASLKSSPVAAALLLATLSGLHDAKSAGDVPAFAGPTPGTLRTIAIPTVDISGDTARQVVVARGTDTAYQGHCDTVLLADCKTMFVAWCMNHAGHLGPLARSDDGGLTWSTDRVVLVVPGQWAQPCVTRSADGRRLVMLMRENTRRHNSLYSLSTDDARTWSKPEELPAALTGDRHVIKQAPDGRLVVAFRDMSKASPTYGHYVAWVGIFEDIENHREGQYRIKLLHNANRAAADAPGTGNTDCGYSDLELLPDGTFVATTYIKYAPGPEKNSVVSARFTLSETDALAQQQDVTTSLPSRSSGTTTSRRRSSSASRP